MASNRSLHRQLSDTFSKLENIKERKSSGNTFRMDSLKTKHINDEKHKDKQSERIKIAFMEFVDRTTIHGCRYLTKATTSKFRRLLWLLLLITCVGAVLYNITDRFIYFYSRPVTVNVRINYNKTLKFPAITICNQNAFKATLATEQDRYRLIEAMYSSNEPLNSTMVEYQGKNITLEELYTKASHRKEDFIFECIWRDSTCDINDFTTSLTDHGVCFTWQKHMEEFYVSSSGVENGLRLKLNIEQNEYMPGPHGAAGLKFLLHDGTEVPMVHALGQAVSPGSHVFVGVKLTEVNNLPEPYGMCSETELEYVTRYSQVACKLNCLSKIANATCGCRHFYLPHNKGVPKVCTISQYYTCLKGVIDTFPSVYEEKCNCPVPCRLFGFETDLSYAIISKYAIDKYLTKNNSVQLKESLVYAKEVTSRMDRSKFEEIHKIAEKFEVELHHIKECILNTLDSTIHTSKHLLEGEINHMEWLCKWKTFVFDYQLYIVEKNFLRFKDSMEERHAHIVALAYEEYSLSLQHDIEYLNDIDFSEDAIRRFLQQSVQNKLDTRIEIISRTITNYTNLINAYQTGEGLFKYQYKDYPKEENKFAVPKKSLKASVEGNAQAKVKLYTVNLNTTIEILYQLKKINKDAFSKQLSKAELQSVIKSFRKTIMNWLNVKKYVYEDVLEEALKQLTVNRNKFSNICFTFDNIASSVFKKIESLDTKIENIETSLFGPLDSIHELVHEYLHGGKGFLYSIAENFTSGGILIGKANLVKLMYELLADDSLLRTSITEMKTLVIQIHKYVINDFDAHEYYEHTGNIQLLRNMSEVEFEIEKNYTTYLNSIQFYDTVGDEGLKFAKSVIEIVNYFQEYIESLQLNEMYIRENFAQLDIFYRRMSYEEITQQKAFDTFALFCDIGGSMGLFLGASLLSLCELLDLVWININVLRSKRGRNEPNTILVKPAVRHSSITC